MILETKKFKEFLATKDLASQTADKYYRISLWFVEHYDVENPASISQFMASTDRRYSERFALKYLFEFLGRRKVYRQWAAENRGRFIEKPRRVTLKHKTKEELRMILSCMRFPWSLMGELQYGAGLRSGALFKICLTDVYKNDAGETFITVSEKGGVKFSVYLTPETAEKIWRIIPAMPTSIDERKSIHLFNTNAHAYNRALRKACVELNTTPISSHWLRTSRVVHLLESGCDFMTVSRTVCRHKKPETTAIYASSAGVDTRAVFQKYGGL